MWYEKFIDNGLIPDYLLRLGIKIQLLNRLNTLSSYDDDIETLFSTGEISTHSNEANDQHYEVPIEFFEMILGKFMKYSSGLTNLKSDSLNQLEKQMLDLVSKRALLENGQEILELGCGWGSSTLYYASKYLDSKFVAVTNSQLQKTFIENKLKILDLNNVKIVKSDISDFNTKNKFDRILSIEMFEHMNNWTKLLNNTFEWLKNDGRLFIHYFCHKNYYYRFSKDSNSWMEKYFFSGGSMPNLDILKMIDHSYKIEELRRVSGMNYHKTLELWYENLKLNKNKIMKTDFKDDKLSSKIHYNRWKVFILACSELFKLHNGEEYLVAHALLKK